MQVIRINHDNFYLWKDQIAELFNISIRINFPNAEVEENFGAVKCEEVCTFLEDGSAIVFAAIEGEKLAGWVWCHHIYRLDGLRIHIAEIVVTEEWHRRGIGSKLLETVERYAVESGYKAIDLLVTSSNMSAVNFYEKAGFKPERYLMYKTINSGFPVGENMDV